MWKGTKGILLTVLAGIATAGRQQGLEGEVQELDLRVHADSTSDHIRGIEAAPQAGFRTQPDRSPLAGRPFLLTFLDRLDYPLDKMKIVEPSFRALPQNLGYLPYFVFLSQYPPSRARHPLDTG